jgi:hypothetical protein
VRRLGAEMLVGRDHERWQLQRAATEGAAGNGSLVLLSGEAGIGKTRLAEAVAVDSGARVLRGAARRDTTPPHGPFVAALRSRLRDDPGALDGCGPLREHLALFMPELGAPAAESDRETILEAFRSALAELSEEEPLILILDDLQWSDDATLEQLDFLAPSLAGLSVLAVGVYRSDELPRDHSLRRLRNELRRREELVEIGLEPLDGEAGGSWPPRSSEGPLRPRSPGRSKTGPRGSPSSSRR